MDSFKYEIELEPKSEDIECLGAGLTEHSKPYIQEQGFKPIAIFLRDENGKIIGGISGVLNWNWLSISLLWLNDSLRGTGCGKKLVETLEHEAKKQGCDSAHLDTFSFQARPFYESLGYKVFSTLENYPTGHQRFFMKKPLS